MHLLSSLKSDIVRTVLSFLGMINDGGAHRDDGCHSNTPMLHSHLIFSLIQLYVCAGYDKACHGMVSYLPLVQRIQAVVSSHLMCHQRAAQI